MGEYLRQHVSRRRKGRPPPTADKARVIFHHPRVSRRLGDLVLHVNPYEITWAYGLNTANFPTYGGEVVQILSMYFDDMEISGEVRGYADLERTYSWFLSYIQIATQAGEFNQHAVTFSYPARHWKMKIRPKALPGFRLGRDVVASQYRIVAAVVEPDERLEHAILTRDTWRANQKKAGLPTFNKATAAIGFREDNPWSGPTGATFVSEDQKAANKSTGDFFQDLTKDYLSGNFDDLFPPGASKPPADQLGGELAKAAKKNSTTQKKDAPKKK